MAKLPRRPDLERLRALAPALLELPVGTELFRIYFRGGNHPTLWNAFRHFGPTAARFDHHEPNAEGDPYIQERAVTYCAASAVTSIAEVFQGPPRVIHRERNDPWLVAFELASTVTLLDLTGRFPVRAGASMKLMSGPRPVSRNWVRGFYDAYPDIEGLIYPSSLTNEPAIVFNERIGNGAFPRTPNFHRALSDPVMLTPLRNVARDLNYGLI